MEYSSIQLNHLPDEILIYIFKKLSNAEILYSLSGVNKRLNKIVHDSIFTNDLSLFMSTSDGLVYSLSDLILDRFYSHILPSIHQKIQWLHLESVSMERILHVKNYPNLYGISLHNIEEKKAIDLFTNETSIIRTLKNQLLSLTIDIRINRPQDYLTSNNAIIFNRIFTMFPNLQYLNFGRSSISDERLSFWFRRPTVISTNLLELHVCLRTFYDCLYLLDGHFNQLRILYVDVYVINFMNRSVNNTEKLPNLKSFSLHCRSKIFVYDELVVPFLHRMSNLEKLDLYINIDGRKTFFDGNDLKMNIINHMSQLNKFTFNIHSLSRFYNEINLPSNEDIQKTFKDFKDKQIIYWSDYFPKRKNGYCRIYSYPYTLKYYDDITNNFSGGVFKYVRKVSLFDERPFEHEFFLRIAQSFPFMEELTVCNKERQINKQFRNSKNLSIIKYPYLKQLDLIQSCIDYYEQFLCDTLTYLPFDVRLLMNHKLVTKVTHNFTRNRTRNNCAKINYVNLCIELQEDDGYSDNFSDGKQQVPQYIKDYFPHTQIN
ncbi:unnamed protein product [Rotaria sordida]|uniref:F-box domain-containing protein n=1 Tax=Rotaria sordida TaxID=392033 RepID=A0A819YCA2_9BILA|nr:unnamed protein product [Rotaria sordida]